jgi:hypothetical protein
VMVTASLFTSIMGAGCISSGPPPPGPPSGFTVEKIRYWWENETLVVNVTMKNNDNFTLTGSFHSWVDIDPRELRVKTGAGYRPGEELESAGGPVTGPDCGHAKVSFSSTEGNNQRWYDECLELEMSLARQYYVVGPSEVPPNGIITAEVGFSLNNSFHGNEGYYDIYVSTQTRWMSGTEYRTGCFNRDVPEFYGVRPDGPDCEYWDCTGYPTVYGDDKYHSFGKPGPHTWQYFWTLPTCTATDAIGPYDEHW